MLVLVINRKDYMEVKRHMFKSRLVKLAKFEVINVSEVMQGTPIGEDEIRVILDNLAKKHVTITSSDVDAIEKGVPVTLDLSGSETKFNRKNLSLTVGLGLFNAELENQIIGMKKGEKKTLNINGNDVLVEVKTVMRRNVPKVTDQIVASLNIEGVNTIKDYKEHVINKDLKEQKVQNILLKGPKYLLENSEYDISGDDISFINEEQKKSLIHTAKLRDMTLEQLLKRNGTSLEKLAEKTEERIKYTLIGMEYAKEDNSLFNQEMYDDRIKNASEIQKVSKEDAIKTNPYVLQAIGYYVGKMQEEVFKFLKDEIH